MDDGLAPPPQAGCGTGPFWGSGAARTIPGALPVRQAAVRTQARSGSGIPQACRPWAACWESPAACPRTPMAPGAGSGTGPGTGFQTRRVHGRHVDGPGWSTSVPRHPMGPAGDFSGASEPGAGRAVCAARGSQPGEPVSLRTVQTDLRAFQGCGSVLPQGSAHASPNQPAPVRASRALRLQSTGMAGQLPAMPAIGGTRSWAATGTAAYSQPRHRHSSSPGPHRTATIRNRMSVPPTLVQGHSFNFADFGWGLSTAPRVSMKPGWCASGPWRLPPVQEVAYPASVCPSSGTGASAV